jgi:hypothetical protein
MNKIGFKNKRLKEKGISIFQILICPFPSAFCF